MIFILVKRHAVAKSHKRKKWVKMVVNSCIAVYVFLFNAILNAMLNL